MSEIKGYVVRGKHKTHGDITAWSSDGSIGERAGAVVFKTLDGAAGARAGLVYRGCADVRIFAVAEDGTETPLPTYEEALADVERLRTQATDDVIGAARIMRESLNTERAAWARLVKAERRYHDQTDLLGERDDDAKGARTGVDDAVQALRDLGVDVDALLGDP